MRILADGSALVRSVLPSPEMAAWEAFQYDQDNDVVTTAIGVSSLRRQTQVLGHANWMMTLDFLYWLEVVPISEEAVIAAAYAVHVLEPFVALHIGVASEDPRIDAIATYEPALAIASNFFGVPVISPGRDDQWWSLSPSDEVVQHQYPVQRSPVKERLDALASVGAMQSLHKD